MRNLRVFSLTVTVLLSAVAAYGYLGQVTFSFDVKPEARGLGIGPGYLYHLHRIDTRKCRVNIYRSDNGSLVDSWDTPVRGEFYGCTYTEGGYLWISREFYWTYKCDASTGSLYGSWTLGSDGLAPLCTGDYGAGATALFTSGWGYDIYKYDLTTHSFLSSFTNEVQEPQELAYDWRNELVWSSYEHGSIWSCTTTGSFVTFLPEAIGTNHLRGLAYSDGYLWVTVGNICCKVHCPYDFVGVTPASLGKVRALFR